MERAFVFLGLTSLCFLGGCGEGTPRDVVTTVLLLRGEVVYSSDGTENFRSVTSETKFGRPSFLRTSQDAEIDLALIPGALARLLGESELKIEQLKLTKDGNETGDAMRERVARIELRRGGMIVLF